MLLKSTAIILIFISILTSPLSAQEVRQTAFLPVIISYLLSDTSYYKPKQVVCEAGGGEWIVTDELGNTVNECSAKWDSAMNICSMPTQKQWETLMLNCGADLEEYDDENAPYKACYQNAGYLNDLYWSINVNSATDKVYAADFDSGKIPEKFKTSSYFVRCTQGGKVLTPPVLPANNIYEIPPKVACEAGGGDWNDSGYEECSASWSEASTICKLPTDANWQSVITGCGGDLAEYDDESILYNMCYQNAGYAPLVYYSSQHNGADIEVGKKIQNDGAEHTYLVRCLPNTLRSYKPSPEACEQEDGSWDEVTDECHSRWEDAANICHLPDETKWRKVVTDCGGNPDDYNDENPAYVQCYQTAGYKPTRYWSETKSDIEGEKIAIDMDTGLIKSTPFGAPSYHENAVRCIAGGF